MGWEELVDTAGAVVLVLCLLFAVRWGLLRTGVTCGRHGMSHTFLTVLLRQRRQDGSTRVSTLTAVECAPAGVQQAQQASAALAEVVRSGVSESPRRSVSTQTLSALASL